MSERERCKENVYVRDTLRYTGRSKGGFEMHYNKKQCSRYARIEGYCRQHAAYHGLIATEFNWRTKRSRIKP